jgi:hypothetical protein
MMSKLPPSERSRIVVGLLPNGITVAGEWHLGIPAYSAAPDVGLDIIRLLTTKDAELNRLRLGVGLPTGRTFYSGRDLPVRKKAEISPYFSIGSDLPELEALINNAFRRSDFHCYRKISRMLSLYLRKVIELPKASHARIADLFGELGGSEEFVQSDWDCNGCAFNRSKQCCGKKPISTDVAHPN